MRPPDWIPVPGGLAGSVLPEPRRYVLLQLAATAPAPTSVPGILASLPPCVVVGYLKFAAGDRTCPYFVVPGFPAAFSVTHWADCLGDDFAAPLWRGAQRPRRE